MESKGKVKKKKKKVSRTSEDDEEPLSPHAEHDANHEKTRAKFDELLMTLQQGADETGKEGKKKKKKKSRAQTAESVLQTLKDGADLRKDTDDTAILANTYNARDSPRFDKNTTNERRRKLPPKRGVENQGYVNDDVDEGEIPPEENEVKRGKKKKKGRKSETDIPMTLSELEDTPKKPKKKKKRRPTEEELDEEEGQEDVKPEQDEEEVPMEEETETKSAIKSKGKKKKKKKETKDSTDGAGAEAEEGEEEEEKVEEPPKPPEDDGRLLGITIHRSDRLKSDLFIAHPLVRVHLIDLETGNYVKKPMVDRAVTSYYETRNEKVNYIMPVLTQPFDFKKRKSMIPSWEEQLIYNESYLYLTRTQDTYPQIIVFFELLDFVSMAQANTQINRQKQKGWHRIAWAFLKVTGSNGALNTEKKVRLQLFYPPFAFKAKPTQLDVFQWWMNHPRQAYPSTLYVTLKPINTPENVEPSFRSQFANQEEQGKMTYKELHSTINWGRTDRSSEKKAAPTNWSRLPGQMCRIPNKQLHQLAGDKKGCFVIKFSHNGRSLACGCKDRDGYPVIVYDIPSGRVKCQFPGHYSLFYDICWSPTDTEILTASSDGTARIWDMDTPDSSAAKVFPHPAFVYTARYHPQADFLVVTGGYDHVIRVWSKKSNAQNGELLQELSGHKGFINSLCFSRDGKNMYSADSIGTVIIWKVNVYNGAATSGSRDEWKRVKVHQEKELEGTVINYIEVHPSGRRLLVHGRDNHLRMMELRLYTIMQRYVGTLNFKEQIRSALTGCGSFVFSGSEDYQAYVWNADTGDLVATYNDLGYKHPVCDVDYHPYDHMVAFCSRGEGHPVLIYGYDSKVAQLELVLRKQLGTEQTPEQVATTRSNQKSLASLLDAKRTLTAEMETSKTQRMERVQAKLASVMAFTSLSQTSQQSPMTSMQPPSFAYTPGGTTPMQPTMSTWGSTFDTTRFMQSQTPASATKPPIGPGIPSLSQAERPGMSPFLQASLQQTPQRGLGNTMASSSGWTSRPYFPRGRVPNISLQTSTAGNATFTFNPPPAQDKTQEHLQVVALYDYTAQRSDELSLQAGSVIYVLHQDNENWWMGQLENGQQGYFPANYVADPNEEERPGVPIDDEDMGGAGGFDEVDSATPRRRKKGKSKKKTMTAVITKSGEYKVISATEDSEADTPATTKGTKKKKKKPLAQQLAQDLAENTTDGDTPGRRRPRARTTSSARKLAPTFDLMDGEETPKQISKKKRSKSQDRDINGTESRDEETPRQRTKKKRAKSAERQLDVDSRDEETPRRRTRRAGSRENLLSGEELEGMSEKKSGKRKQKPHHVERTV